MRTLPTAAILLLAGASLSADDWPMFGGRPDRNMASGEKGLPEKWAKDGKKDVFWSAALGSQTFGGAAISGGRIFIGTDNGKTRSPKEIKGVLRCFSEKDGSFLWKAVHDQLPGGASEDQGYIASTPCVVGDRVYYVSNRAELVCADVAGFSDDENDGTFTGETLKGPQDADFVWVLDLKKEFGVILDQAAASSPLVVDGLVFVLTGQSKGVAADKVTNPDCPSFLAVDAATGKVAWKDASPGAAIREGQWSSPAYGTVDGAAQVCFPGGDGKLYAFEPKTGKPLWTFDAGVVDKPSEEGGKPRHNYFVAAPVYAGHRVIIGTGQNPENSSAPAALVALDARKRGTIGQDGVLWALAGKEFTRTISTVAVQDGLVYAIELTGLLNCIELETGKPVWKHDMLATTWGSPMLADGKIYVQTGDGEVLVLQAGREKKLLATNMLPGLAHGTPVAANGVLYIAGDSKLYALKKAN